MERWAFVIAAVEDDTQRNGAVTVCITFNNEWFPNLEIILGNFDLF